MKTKLGRRLLALPVLVFAGISAYAQDTLPVQTLPPVTITATQKTVPEKVWTNFHSYFANAQDPKWYMVNKNYLIKFMTDEDLNHALFTKRGELIYHISYGYEKSMPSDVRDAVKSVYYNYDITRAIKVSEANRVIWVVNVENAKELLLIRVENGEVEQVQALKKS